MGLLLGGAQGSTYEYTISGGYCVVTGEAGPVTCKKPSIELTTQGSFCNLATKTPTQIKVHCCPYPICAACLPW